MLITMTSSLATRRALLGGVLFAIVVSARFGAQAQTSQKQTILSLLQARQFAEAEAAARHSLASSPGDCTVQTMLGLALRGEGQELEAYKSFVAATKLCPTLLAAVEGAAEVAYSRRMANAKELLAKVIALRPDDGTAHAMLGALDAESGDCEGSVANYARSPSQVDGSASALQQYGGCLLTLGRASEAVDIFTHLLAVQENAQNRQALARAQMEAGRHADAVATLQPLLSGDSPDASALLLAAEVAEADNHTPQAIAWLRQAMQVDPKRVECYLYFAEISFNHGSYQVGIDFLDLGLKVLPGDARLYLARGVLEVQLAKLDNALSDFREAHRLDPKLTFADDAMGVLFSQKHDLTSALTLFEERSKQQPNDPLLQYLYAEALSESGTDDPKRIEVAIAAARRALLLEPSYQPARDLLCVLLLRHGEFQAVVEQAAEATKRQPYDEVALYQALLAERKLKHPEQTEDLVRRLAEAKAHNQTAVTKYVLEESGSPQVQK